MTLQRRELVLSILALGALCGCGQRPAGPRDVVVGSSPTGVPFSFVDPASNELAGAMVDCANLIISNTQRTALFEIVPFSALIPSLVAGKIDLIAAAILRTPERERVVAFSDPIYSYAGAVVVRSAHSGRVATLADLREKRVAVQVGTRFVDQLVEAGVGNISTYDGLSQMLRDLDNGRVDAAYGDEPILEYQVRVGPRRDVRIVEEFVAPAKEELSLVMRQGDPRLVEINRAIEALRDSAIPAVTREWGLS